MWFTFMHRMPPLFFILIFRSNSHENDLCLISSYFLYIIVSYIFFFFRMRIENATLKESMESMEHLTSSIHRLRVSLSKVVLVL